MNQTQDISISCPIKRGDFWFEKNDEIVKELFDGWMGVGIDNPLINKTSILSHTTIKKILYNPFKKTNIGETV